MKNNSLNIIAISILIIAFSVFYYFVIFLPKQETLRIESEKRTKETQQSLLDNCLYDVDVHTAEVLREALEGNLGVPHNVTELIESDKNECYKKYPQN